ncbi:predicted protein [Methanosarcina acetivorans C2A]|uniref:Uncharacterized protein n=1 Tax=Methanosarcina acetivorans (strain ATCC 35395 / DSM 2834 / JCM 12185 / C2A) TaxID=188937 RepID=Q8TNP6_METAC|nr:predicted protein [Methanosarcina acetivorans C2A]
MKYITCLVTCWKSESIKKRAKYSVLKTISNFLNQLTTLTFRIFFIIIYIVHKYPIYTREYLLKKVYSFTYDFPEKGKILKGKKKVVNASFCSFLHQQPFNFIFTVLYRLY